MSIYHYSIQIIGRSSGRSAVAAAAYRSGSKLYDEELQKQNDYTHKSEVVHSEIMLPDNAPSAYTDREQLWNAVQKIEKASNAQLAREIEFALPVELTREQQIKLARDYIKKNFVDKGMCADWSIHDKGDGNPHVHLMLTTRGIKNNGEWEAKEKKDYARDENGERIPIIDPATGEQKLGRRNEKMWQRVTVQANDWNSRENAELWRESWAKECNKYLSPEQQIDHRSYARQGIDKVPTIHEGYAAREMEARGEVSDRCEYNRQVKFLEFIKAEYHKKTKEIEELKEFIRKMKEKIQQTTGYQMIDNLLHGKKKEDKSKEQKIHPKFDDLVKRANERQKEQAEKETQNKTNKYGNNNPDTFSH